MSKDIKESEYEGALRSPRIYVGRIIDRSHEQYGKWSLWMVDFVEIMTGNIAYFDTMAEAIESMHDYLKWVETEHPSRWEKWVNG